MHDAVDRMLLAKGKKPSPTKMYAPFDTAKPNIHDSKSEFLAEKAAVEVALERAEGLLELFVLGHFGQDETNVVAARRICGFVDHNSRLDQQLGRSGLVETFIVKGMVDSGFTRNLAYALHEFKRSLSVRLQDLANQEREFWSSRSRPPNHYARAIALRLARYYCRELGEKPTSGVSGDGGHPSTVFTRALQEIFEVLEISANARNAADWAISQLTEQDLRNPMTFSGELASTPLPMIWDKVFRQTYSPIETKGSTLHPFWDG